MNYYNEIKRELINNEITKKVKDYSRNRSDLSTYYNVGKLLSEAGKQYGEGVMKEYSRKLTKELGKGYTTKSLFKYRKFYTIFKKISTLSRQLTWSHYSELLSLKNYEEIFYYIMISEQQNLSIRELRLKIKNKEYERLDETTRNKLVTKEDNNVNDFIKNPIFIKNTYKYTKISENILKKLILEDISNFLKELGNGFSFIDSEYKIKVGDRYNYIDLLLYNIVFKCYVVIELKIIELKKDHIGQIQTYMNYIDKNIKTNEEDKTIGIIIVKKDNKFIMEYCSDKRIITKEYLLI